MIAILALGLATTPIAYVLPESKVFPQGQLVVKGVPGAKVPNVGLVREPALSPDRTRVLFWSDAKGLPLEAPIKELNLRTGKVRLVASGNCRSPGWSPDGKWIFFTRYGKGWNLMIQSVGGNKATPILGPSTKSDVFMPVWSPGNASIVAHDMTNVMWVYPGGTRERSTPVSQVLSDAGLITSAETFTDRPGASTMLAFTQEGPGVRELRDEMTGLVGAVYLYDTKTRKRRRLTPENFSVRTPRWSPDGEWIYFQGRRSLRAQGRAVIEQGIWRMKPDDVVVELVARGGEEFSL